MSGIYSAGYPSQNDPRNIRWLLVDSYFKNLIRSSVAEAVLETPYGMPLLKLLADLPSLELMFPLPTKDRLTFMEREKQTGRATYTLLWLHKLLARTF